MNMEGSIINSWGVDPGYIILGMVIIILILFITVIVSLIKMSQLYRRYDIFMRGKDAESMEEAILRKFAEVDNLEEKDKQKQQKIEELYEKLKGVYQKMGIVKYDAFHEMGGKLSFSIAILDEENSGYVMNSMHSQEGCYTYIKEIIKGKSFITLGEEEKQALEQAIKCKTIPIE